MIAAIRVLGIIVALLGVGLMIRPAMMKQLMTFMGQGKRIYWAGVLRLVFGVILLLGALQCRLVWVIVIMGILFLTGGVLIFVLGPGKIRSILDWCNKKSLIVLRSWALVAVALGLLIIYSA